MNYALIKDGVIKNIIVIDDPSVLELFKDWDHCIRVDHLEVIPHIGWRYDEASQTFTSN
jgi:hypothetical protein